MFLSALTILNRVVFTPWKLFHVLSAIGAMIFIKVFWTKMFLIYAVLCALAITFCYKSPAQCSIDLVTFFKTRVLRMKAKVSDVAEDILTTVEGEHIPAK